jgi:hypothetical protein
LERFHSERFHSERFRAPYGPLRASHRALMELHKNILRTAMQKSFFFTPVAGCNEKIPLRTIEEKLNFFARLAFYFALDTVIEYKIFISERVVIF